MLDKLKAHFEVPTTRYLWIPEDAVEFTPRVCSKKWGDGKKLFSFSTLNDRPRFWIIQGDSSWNSYGIHDHVDDIFYAIAEEFGDATCDCEDCDDHPLEYPAIDDRGGMSWREIAWPKSVQLEPA